jgi:manganese/zinc/iron transport system substrate-binding protein
MGHFLGQFFWAALCSVFMLALSGCKQGNNETKSLSPAGKLRITATTSMVADLVKQVGGDKVEVQSLMGPGVDPHLYKATATDITRLQNANVIFYSGLMLEGKMQEIFTKMSSAGKRVYAVTSGLAPASLLHPPGAAGHPDPHVWFDVPLWAQCADVVASGLGDAKPADRAYFEQRAAEVKKKLSELHQWAVQHISEIPKEQRILVTSHDAFSYFGRAYDFQVVGLQGISTVTESSLADMAQMVEFIRRNKVKAIFVESSVAPNTLRRISQDAGVRIGGELFSDAMGTPGQIENGYDLGTYEGMIKHNISTIVSALKQP